MDASDNLQSISAESVAALQTRYTFLQNAIPDLEKQYSDLQDKTAQAQVDYDKACGLKSDALDAKEAALTDKENGLNIQAQSLRDKENELIAKAQDVSDAEKAVQQEKDTVLNLISQHDSLRENSDARQKQLDDRQEGINAAEATLAVVKADFEAYRALVETNITQRNQRLDADQKKASDSVSKYSGLMEELLRKLSALDAQKPALDAASLDIQNKAQALVDRTNAIVAKENILATADADLKTRAAFLDSKELELKAIKAQQDKRESKIKELIANSGTQLTDIVL